MNFLPSTMVRFYSKSEIGLAAVKLLHGWQCSRNSNNSTCFNWITLIDIFTLFGNISLEQVCCSFHENPDFLKCNGFLVKWHTVQREWSNWKSNHYVWTKNGKKNDEKRHWKSVEWEFRSYWIIEYFECWWSFGAKLIVFSCLFQHFEKTTWNNATESFIRFIAYR